MKQVFFALAVLFVLTLGALTLAKPVMIADGGSIPLCPPPGHQNNNPQCNPNGGPK